MHSPSNPAELGPCGQQGDGAGVVVSPFEDPDDDDGSTDVDLSATGRLVADARLNQQGTTSSVNAHGSSFLFHQTASPPHCAACHSQVPGHADEDGDGQDLGDPEDGATLDHGAVVAQQQQPALYSESYLGGSLAADGPGAEKSDDSYSDISEADGTNNAQHQTHDNHATSFPHPPHTHLNVNGPPPNFPSHLHTLYGAALAMSTEFPGAAWGQDSWSVAGNVNLPAPNAMVETNTPGLDDAVNELPPVQLSNPNPAIPGSENLGLVDFLHDWALQEGYSHRPPFLQQVGKQARSRVAEVNYSDLNGDCCDFQALDWAAMGTTRNTARTRRRRAYKNYVNRAGSDLLASEAADAGTPSHESFFRFRRMTVRQDVHLAHFQLRSVLACPSRTFAFYASPMGINRINTVSRKTDCVMSMREFPSMGGALSALDAGCGVLMGGTFNGDYYVKPLDCDDKTRFAEGQITSDFSGITNHIKVYRPRRSWGPVAAIASNDCGFRIMDITTEHFISETMYPFALNCSALSPDHRLRVVVGDESNVLITNADTGEVLQQLSGHRDYGFACDWSEDGWTVATGFQDRWVKIWDARKWCNSRGISTPLCALRSEMASVRGLRFSPLGSGQRVLVAAEEADFISFFDAQTFCSKQTIDLFGEIGGVAFTNEGQSLNILCCDSHRGGLLQVERCGRRPEPILDHVWPRNPPRFRHWADRDDYECLVNGDWRSRRRRPTLLDGDVEPF